MRFRTVSLLFAALATLAACGDIDTAAPPTPSSAPPITAPTTTTIDPAALTAWYEAVAASEAAAEAPAPPTTRHKSAAGSTSRRAASRGTLTPARLPCAIPAYICTRESGDTVDARNPHSTASGKYQFLDSTWAHYGGYPTAADAPEEVQDAAARDLWAGGAGCSHWSAC